MKKLELRIQMKKEKIPFLVTDRSSVTQTSLRVFRLQVDQMWTHTQNYASHWSLIEHLDLLEQTTILIAVLKKSLPPSCNSANSRKHFDFLPWHLVAVIIYINLNWMSVSEGGLTSLKSAVRLGSPTSCADPHYTSFHWMIYILLYLACIMYPEFSTCLII